MPDMQPWYPDDGFPPCGMPPSTIPPLLDPMPQPMAQLQSEPQSMQPSEPQPMPQPQSEPQPMPQPPSFGDSMSRFPIAMGYVPIQNWQQPYAVEQALGRGTIFSELDLPFMMGRCM